MYWPYWSINWLTVFSNAFNSVLFSILLGSENIVTNTPSLSVAVTLVQLFTV